MTARRPADPAVTPPAEATSAAGPRDSGLRRVLTTRSAVALYVSSVLGVSILVVPGLAAQIAGPASLLAWASLGVVSIAFAFTVAGLSIRRPEAGGVYGFAREAFGRTGSQLVGWLFFLWMVTGAPVVALIASAYLAYAFPLTVLEVDLIAWGVLAAACIVNLRGIVLTGAVQIAIIVAIVGLLAVTLVVAGTHLDPGRFQPFFPDGLYPVGTSIALVFWSYLGYENVSNVAEEFERPAASLRRGVWISLAVIGSLYFALAVVIIGSGADTAGGGTAPFAAVASLLFGGAGAQVTALLALVIVFAVVNAYVAGMSRVFFAMARAGDLPSALARLDPRTGAPTRVIGVMLVCVTVASMAYDLLGLPLSTAFLVTSGAALGVYAIGSAAGLRIFARDRTVHRFYLGCAGCTLAVSLGILPFVGWPLAITGGLVGVVLLYRALVGFRRRSGTDPGAPGAGEPPLDSGRDPTPGPGRLQASPASLGRRGRR